MRLTLFLLVFVTVYGLMHALLYWGVAPVLEKLKIPRAGVLAFMGLMIMAPVMERTIERFGFETTARAVAWVSYLWMGFAFITFVLVAALGLAELARLVLVKLFSFQAQESLRTLLAASIILTISASLSFYSLFEAGDMQTEELAFSSAAMANSPRSLKIMQISDVHLGVMLQEGKLAEIKRKFDELSPDLLLVTGDLLDGETDGISRLAPLLREINPPLGKFAVLGNHEYFTGVDKSLGFLSNSGIVVLRDQMAKVGDSVLLLGLDDAGGARVSDFIKAKDPNRFTIVMRHRPYVDDDSAGLFDLQLSGHTHKGQIFPFRYLVKAVFPRDAGLYDLGGGSFLYVSRGTGTWGPPMRLLSKPEVTSITISGS